MEPRARAAQEADRADRATRVRLRSPRRASLLVGLAFVQAPGLPRRRHQVRPAVDPVEFLGRALHLWDDRGAFGQLQNQAYGYLWPMGPFFASAHVLDLPGWVVQRLWLALVLCVAFLGTARLARALGVALRPRRAWSAGSPSRSRRGCSRVLGPISIEAWPSALAPWVLLPLVLRRRRAARRAGRPRSRPLAVAMVGGVNAAATFAVLPLGVIWLLTRDARAPAYGA